MTIPPTIARLREFIALITEGQPPSDDQVRRALDEMALAYYDCPYVKPAESDAETPTIDFPALYQKLASRFPTYGMYSSADPSVVLLEESLVSDACDDLADIIRDLREVSWRYDALGADDAHWQFRLLFEIHWGKHLRELSLYLHVKRDQ